MYYKNPTGVSVHDGFPNPATDASLQGVDLNKLLVRNGASTYFMRIVGNDWQDSGIFDADIILIDRAIAPRAIDLVVWWYDGAFAVSPYQRLPEGSEVWGVITTAIHPYRSKP